MTHEAGLERTIRKEGMGDREAWGRWWLEELETKEGQGAEKRRCKGGRRWWGDVVMGRGQSHDLLGEWFRDDLMCMHREEEAEDAANGRECWV